MFVDKVAFNPCFREPFLNANYESELWATDGHSLMVVNRECLSGEYPTKEVALPKLMNMNENCSTIITQDALRVALSECPQVDEEIEIGDYMDCKECDGSGEVEWEYTDSKGLCHQQRFYCPCCDGSGYADKPITKKTGKKILDINAAIQIDTMIGATLQINRLLKAMELLEVDEVHHVISYRTQANLFIVNDNIKIFIMPFLRDDVSAIVKTKNIHGDPEMI